MIFQDLFYFFPFFRAQVLKRGIISETVGQCSCLESPEHTATDSWHLENMVQFRNFETLESHSVEFDANFGTVLNFAVHPNHTAQPLFFR